ncbi:hypothetical protein IV203_008332 [Nitzschia inconspicua]|uniref:Uncharacterized protein n=1 Tax=Nitzschia inconspicua TaxID=303405 RepID=A0A9K3KZG4_9STRA|nr:hypothetical protein IV203_008332 [Nitzschia inconspicua]
MPPLTASVGKLPRTLADTAPFPTFLPPHNKLVALWIEVLPLSVPHSSCRTINQLLCGLKCYHCPSQGPCGHSALSQFLPAAQQLSCIADRSAKIVRYTALTVRCTIDQFLCGISARRTTTQLPFGLQC